MDKTNDFSNIVKDIRVKLKDITELSHVLYNENELDQNESDNMQEIKTESVEIDDKSLNNIKLPASELSSTVNIDDDIQKMRTELKSTYDLIVNAQNSLQKIDLQHAFEKKISNKLGSHLLQNDEDSVKLNNNDIDKVLNEVMTNDITDNELENLSKLAKKEVIDQMKSINIPEIGIFLQTCTTLEESFQKLNEQFIRYEQLKDRIIEGINSSCNRIEEIKREIN